MAADMFDSGIHAFESWVKQTKSPNGEIFWNRWLGEFNPKMTAKEANTRLDHVEKITNSGQFDFMRGWEHAQNKYLNKNN